MVNKGLEVMEAHWLFDVGIDRIQVVIQPQSIIHSAVEYADGAVIAQLGTADMKLPIQYALFYPRDVYKRQIEYIEVVLGEYCDELNGTMSLSNAKIEDALTRAWYDANPKNKFKLEYDARDQALRQFIVRLEIMLAWVEHINNMNNRKQDISRLKTLRAELIKEIQEIQKNPAWKNQKNANILAWALAYMQQYLNGQVVKLRIYSEFVYTGLITVGNDGIPDIDHDLAHVKYYEPWRNRCV